jgi:signal transduction histidine kinase
MLVSSTEQLFRVPCHFDCHEPLFVKNGSVAIHLYRIAQEALHNAVKHSCASQVIVSVVLNENEVSVIVKDDGVGMPESEARVNESESAGGLGMHTMHYRAKIIGATLEFITGSNIGTSVICRVPKKKLGR